MNKLIIKAFGGIIFLFLILSICLFLPTNSFNFREAWIYLIVFFSCVTAITFYLMKMDTELLQRRMSAGPVAEARRIQKIIQSFAQFAFIALYIIPSFDHRYQWSRVHESIEFAGDFFVAAGLFIVFLVFRENTFTSATIEVDEKQKVISSGPYSIVRHPMYSGALIMIVGTPLALGSWWGLLAVIPMTFVIIFRLFDEEKFLVTNLKGYNEYRQKVRSKLLPGIF